MTSTPSYEDALASLTAPDGPFCLEEITVRGNRVGAFTNAPPSLRAFLDLARSKGDSEYLVFEDERYSYAQVCDQIDAFAHTLRERYGVSEGDRVAIAMRNFPEWVVAFFAATSIGAIAVALNAWWTTDELAYGLDDCAAKVAVVDDERLERLIPVLDARDLAVVCVRSNTALPDGVDDWAELIDDARRAGVALPAVEVETDSDAMILYTSGTTGHPKGVVSTHRAVMNSLWSFACRSIAYAMSSEPSDADETRYPTSYILVVPLFHVTGLVPVLLGATLGGNKLVMMYRWDPERALELIERERVTTFVGVPTQSHDLIESPSFASTDTSSLKTIGGGGAAAPAELVRKVESSFTGGRPNIGYGMTETNAYGPGNTGDAYVSKPTSTGRAVPTCEMRIVDPQSGREVTSGEVGEVCFRGPHLFRGYWNKPDATAEVLSADGWLRTGDLGYLDEEGFLFLVDRAKDIVIRGGENISCTEVENVVYTHPAVYECAAFGVEHERLGEELAVAIYPNAEHRDHEDGLAQSVQEHVGAHLASYKVPAHVFVFDEPLPRNASGKILRRALRDEVANR